jgi:hypothetical protein
MVLADSPEAVSCPVQQRGYAPRNGRSSACTLVFVYAGTGKMIHTAQFADDVAAFRMLPIPSVNLVWAQGTVTYFPWDVLQPNGQIR